MASNDLDIVSEPIESLEELTYFALVSQDISQDDAKIITDVLMFAEKRKNNQGLVKITKGHLKQREDAGEIRVVKESPVSAQLDGGNRIGMAIISKAVDMAIEKCSKTGIALIGASKYASATGVRFIIYLSVFHYSKLSSYNCYCYFTTNCVASPSRVAQS